MSQFTPPPPAGPSGAAVPSGQAPYGPPPMSVAAVVGFVASLVFCVPFLAQVVGLLCGVVGVAATAGGRRRGRGLAIAAIPISLILLAVYCFGTYGFVKLYQEMVRSARQVQPMLQSAETVAAGVSGLYGRTTSRFRQQVSEADLTKWAEAMIAEHGTLQGIRRAPQFFQSDPQGRMETQYVGQFTNGSANIVVTFAFENDLTPLVDDVQIDGKSPLPNP